MNISRIRVKFPEIDSDVEGTKGDLGTEPCSLPGPFFKSQFVSRRFRYRKGVGGGMWFENRIRDDAVVAIKFSGNKKKRNTDPRRDRGASQLVEKANYLASPCRVERKTILNNGR